MKNLILAVPFLVLTACAGTMNFSDGTWSNCTYSKDGRVIKSPLQVGAVPIEWTEPDGTTVKCEPIPKAE